MSKILKKRVSLMLAIVMMALTIVPIFTVNAASTVEAELKLDGKTINFGSTVEVEAGQVLEFLPSIEGGRVTTIGYKIGDTPTKQFEAKNARITVPTGEPGSSVVINLSAGGFDSEDKVVTMPWKKVTCTYPMPKVDKEEIPSTVEMTIKNGTRVLKDDSVLNVKGGEKIQVTAKSNAGIYAIGYYYSVNGVQGDIKDVFADNLTITVPTGDEGEIKYLYIEAIANDDDSSANTVTKTGWIRIVLKYPEAEKPTENPVAKKTLSVSYGNKVLAVNSTTEANPNEPITMEVGPADEGKTLFFRWNSDAWSRVVNTNKYNTRIPSSFLPGSTHTLTVYAEFEDGTKLSEQKYTFKIPNEAAKLTLNTKLNSKTIVSGKTYEVKGGEEIVVSASAVGTDIDYISYQFGNDSVKKANKSKVTFEVPNEKRGTTLKLYVEAVGEDDSTTGVKTYTLKFVDTIDGELDIEPWMEENDEILELAINLRNDSEEEDKANKNIYSLEETVTYFIDYMNGTGDDITSLVKIVFEVPLDYTIVDADNGDVDNKDNVITWEFPDGLKEDAAGTLVVKLKYNEFTRSKYDNELIYPSAAIFKGKKEQDRSTVINLIVEEYDMEIGENHEPYMFGDKDAPTFRPDDSISRAEGALVLARIYGLDYQKTQVTDLFSDLDETYLEAQKAIVAASKAGLINGGKDGNFRPNSAMTKAEFIKILACMIQGNAEEEGIEGLEIKDAEQNIKIYSDSTRYYIVNGKKIYTHWALNEVTLMARLNMLPLTEDDSEIDLDEEITRAEVAQLVNFYLLRAPANVSSKTKTGFDDVTRKHDLIGDIIEATRASHTFSMNEDDGTENAE